MVVLPDPPLGFRTTMRCMVTLVLSHSGGDAIRSQAYARSGSAASRYVVSHGTAPKPCRPPAHADPQHRRTAAHAALENSAAVPKIARLGTHRQGFPHRASMQAEPNPQPTPAASARETHGFQAEVRELL